MEGGCAAVGTATHAAHAAHTTCATSAAPAADNFYLRQLHRSAGRELFAFHGEKGGGTVLSGKLLGSRVARLGERLARDFPARERLLVLLPQGVELVTSLLACWYANLVAVPVPMAELSEGAQIGERILAIARATRPQAILTTAPLREWLGLGPELGPPAATANEVAAGTDFDLADLARLPVCIVPEAATSPADQVEPVERSGLQFSDSTGPRPQTVDDPALILFTSGSTAEPKGVVLSHRQLRLQGEMAAAQWAMAGDSRVVSWAPLFHSFGLVVGLLAPLAAGATTILLAPGEVVRNPLWWFRSLARERATHTGGANFSLDLCTRVIDPEEIDGSGGHDRLSVAALQSVICGGEPIRRESWQAFLAKFARFGFAESTFSPNYGLSETGSLTCTPPGEGPCFLTIDAADLQRGQVRPAREGRPGKVVTSCGRFGPGITAVVVNPVDCRPAGPEETGEIWVQTPALASGYWQLPAEPTFAADCGKGEEKFFRTGDLGFIRDDYLYLVGRSKELIIVAGKNHFPVDIEWQIRGAVDLALPLAVFALEVAGRERVVVVQEVAGPLPEPAATVDTILGAVSAGSGLDLYEINFVPFGTIPKSDSGKVQRRLCRQAYLENRLAVVYCYRQGVEKEKPNGAAAGRPEIDHLDHLVATIKNRAFLPEIEVSPERLAEVASFHQLGLNSLQYLRVAGRLEALFALPFNPVLLFKYRSFAELASYLATQGGEPVAELAGNGHGVVPVQGKPAALSASTVPAPPESVACPHSQEVEKGQPAAVDRKGQLGQAPATDIAIIGMSCTFPGGVDSPERFWTLIAEGGDAITPLADSRPMVLADAGRYGGSAGELFPPWGGCIDDADCFDAPFFAISPLEAESMDPQQRKLLELVWDLCERAGYNPRTLAGGDTGIFVGAHNTDYADLVAQHPSLVEVYGPFLDSGLHMSLLAHRISRWFDFRGPSELVNTACSSSLVAVHHAVASLQRGECRLAIAAGINLIFAARVHLLAHQAGMLAADGRCKTFAAGADGFARAEGYGAVLLKPWRQAVADRDTIHGRIRAAVVNHDGQSNSLRAPNLAGQKELLRMAWRQAGCSPTSLGYIETHGTGTALGDPIEIQALQEAWAGFAPAEGKTGDALATSSPPEAGCLCALGSVKTVIGHCESAAGIAGLLKVLLAMQHQTVPAIPRLGQCNPLIRLDAGPFYLPRENRPWQRAKNAAGEELPRRAGVSSFGFGGANAHLVVEEYLPEAATCRLAAAGSMLFPLSALNGERLLASAGRLRDHLAVMVSGSAACRLSGVCEGSEEMGEVVPADCAGIAYTLQLGRQAMAARRLFVAEDMNQLRAQLTTFVEGGGAEPGSLSVSVRAALMDPVAERLATAWLAGEAVDWQPLWPGPKPRRLPLPGYPFARQRFWLALPADVERPVPQPAPQQAPPAGEPADTDSLPGENEPAETLLLAPLWEPLPWPSISPATREKGYGGGTGENAAGEGTVLLFAARPEQQQAVRRQFPGLRCFTGSVDESAAASATLAEILGAIPAIERIIWFAPEGGDEGAGKEEFPGESLILAQEEGVMQLFRLVRALHALGYGERKLHWTVCTTLCQAVRAEDDLRPDHAGVHGFVGALAGEYPAWEILLLDLDEAMALLPFLPDLAINTVATPAAGARPLSSRHLESLSTGHLCSSCQTIAVRQGELFVQRLLPVAGTAARPSRFRQNGVYLLIGGSGGLGRVLTDYLQQRYQARVVWLGRRPRQDLPADSPSYFQADCRDEDALRRAISEVRQLYPQLHGVVVSALGSFDQPIAAMDEEVFREILSVKIALAVRVARCVAGAGLDFLLFFSSMAAFEREGGMSGYAAGCTFQDALALRLAREEAGVRGEAGPGIGTRVVRVMNWGYWSVGAGERIARAFQQRIGRRGLLPLHRLEGMAALETLLSAPWPQLALIRQRQRGAATAGHTLILDREELVLQPATALLGSEVVGTLQGIADRVAALGAAGLPEPTVPPAMESLLLKLLARSLESLGLLAVDRSRPTHRYHCWLAESRGWLRRAGLLQGEPGAEIFAGALADPANPADPADLAGLWREWEQAGKKWLADPDLRANALLAQRSLQALPDILAGRRQPTAVLFPEASLELVAGIFQGNRLADFFHGLLAEVVAALLDGWPAVERLRILEIGAGTGGATAALAATLQRGRPKIDEYCYSDLSLAFLDHGQKMYGGPIPAFTTRLVDVERPLAGQGIACGGYQLVVADNALHATANIRRTLRHVKAALAGNGILVLQELAGKSLHAHLTFGLLPGWWLSEDAALRLPGSPGLSAERWRQLLSEAGFTAVSFPAAAAHHLGQQLIVAVSDGIVRQPRPAPLAPPAALPADADAQAGAVAASAVAITSRANASNEEVLRQATVGWCRQLLAGMLRMAPTDLLPAVPLEQYGIDSILISQLSRKLRDLFAGIEPTLVYQLRCLDDLVDHLLTHERKSLTRLLGAEQAESGGSGESNGNGGEPACGAGKGKAAEPAPIAAGGGHGKVATEPIAIIGISGRFPGAENLEMFWQNLLAGSTAIGEIPGQRWRWQDHFQEEPERARAEGKSCCRWGGFLTDCAAFDPLFFHLTPRDAATIDPQERLFLEEAWKAMEDAGYAPSRLSAQQRRRTGVFGGITRQDFKLFACRTDQAGGGMRPTTSFASLVNRVSFHLDLQGPSLPVDTMCSSALVAVDAACRYLKSGGGEMALAGAVNLYLHPAGYAELTNRRMLASSGEATPFAAGGQGFIPGEGVAVAVLKPLSRAEADGDHIHALIIASGAGHDGRTTAYGIPDPSRQAALIAGTLTESAIDPRTISYLEVAANGSAAGDAIEMAAVAKVFADRQGIAGSYRLGSLKGAIGHGEAVAGMAQLAKVVAALRHRTLPPTLLAEKLNPAIDWARLPFQLNSRPLPWQPVLVDGKVVPRRAGITAIGAGGVTAHLVVEEYCRPEPAPAGNSARRAAPPARPLPVLLPISARSRPALTTLVDRWLDYLSSTPDLPLARLACTVQLGREEFSWRLAVVAADQAALQQLLQSFQADEEEVAGLYPGDPATTRPESAGRCLELVAAGDLHAMADCWAGGNRLPWQQLYPGQRPRRLAGLPTYPFAGKLCWPLTTPHPGDAVGPEGPAAAFYRREMATLATPFGEEYLTFAPFPEPLPGFSMSRVLLRPEQHQKEYDLILARQREMRRLLFAGVDFTGVERLLDIGCGYGTDLIQLARRFPHLRGEGYTITAAQAELGRRRAVEMGVADRVAIHHRDSAGAPFTGTFQLLVGIEVTFHIADKKRLFTNIAAALVEGGTLLLVDYIAELRGAMVDAELDLHIPTRMEWAELLARHGLLLTGAVDVSAQIANFVDDPDSLANTSHLPPVNRRMWRNFANQVTPLRRGWLRYSLLTIRRQGEGDRAHRYAVNLARLGDQTPYLQALAALRSGLPPSPEVAAGDGSRLQDGMSAPPDFFTEKTAAAAVCQVAAASVVDIGERLRDIVAITLGVSPTEVDSQPSFRALGIGSVNAVELLEAINQAFALHLPTSILFACGSLTALAEYLAEVLADRPHISSSEPGCGWPAERPVGAVVADSQFDCRPVGKAVNHSINCTSNHSSIHEVNHSDSHPEDRTGRQGAAIAVIGIACRCAGADDPQALWDLVRQGRECTTAIDNPDWLDYFNRHSPRPVPRRYGAMAGPAAFDPLFFQISPKELAAMSLSQRLVLAEAYRALEDAGHAPASLRDQAVGTYIGVMGGGGENGDHCHFSLLGGENSILAARLAYFLDLKGPALAINTACSSSLVAVDLACRALQVGEIDLALAGGVSVWDNPADFVTMHNAGMLSPTGRCRPFDEGADGIVVGDGVGIVVLKRLADARRDQDSVYGVIMASGTNQDGRTAGITAPSFLAQSRLQREVYGKGAIDPELLQYIEAHGTGTSLGDPVEVHALTEAFRQYSRRSRFCAIGSLKANIGHTAAAAGVLSLIKVLLCLHWRQLPPAVNFARENSRIDFAASPVYVNRQLCEWPANRHGPRLAAVSSFGFSGTNAHLVVAEDLPPLPPSDRHAERANDQPPAAPPLNPPGPQIVPLSARSVEDLHLVARRLLARLDEDMSAVAEPLPLADLAYTLQLGRDPHPCRLALLVSTPAELAAGLAAYLAGESGVAGLYQGQVEEHLDGDSWQALASDPDIAAAIDHWLDQGKHRQLARFWVRGLVIDWSRLARPGRLRRLHLPGYPFPRGGGGPGRMKAETLPDPLLFVRSFQPLVALTEEVAGSSPPGPDPFPRQLLFSFLAMTPPAGVNWQRLFVPGGRPAEQFARAALALFASLQGLLTEGGDEPVLLQVLVPASGEGRLFAALGGLLNTARAENPRITGQLIEVAEEVAEAELPELLERCRRWPEAAHLRLTPDQCLQATFTELPAPAVAPPLPWRRQGVYLISGGAGGLGLLFAEEIARHVPAATLVLVGRSPLAPAAAARIAALCTAGSAAGYRQVDVGDEGAVDALLSGIVEQFGHLDGILHAAGVKEDSFLRHKTAAAFARVLSPKVAGTVNLDRASRKLPIDFFVLFSSGAVQGNPGQADYATANAFLDAYALHRQELVAAGERHGLSLAVNWPLWQQGGMQVDPATAEVLRQESGMEAMCTASGFAAFYRAVAAGVNQVLVGSGEPDKIRAGLGLNQLEERAAQPCLAEQSAAPNAAPNATPTVVIAAGQPPSSLAPAVLREGVVARLKELIGEVLQIPAATLRLRQPLASYGIDSVVVTQLNARLAGHFGPLARTLFFEYQSIEAVAGYLLSRRRAGCLAWLGGAAPGGSTELATDEGETPPVRPQSRPCQDAQRGAAEEEPIAIIGLAGQYPGATGIGRFWRNLLAGHCAIAEIPPCRWSLAGFYQPNPERAQREMKSYAKVGGFLTSFADFDPLFFRISPVDAIHIDPQERLVLTSCWQAMEASGYSRQALARCSGRRVGVFVGVSKNHFLLHTRLGGSREASRLPLSSFSAMANRVSYHLNLTGPSMAIDTMCSSAFTAIDAACSHIRRGACQMAFAAAVNLYLHPRSYLDLCQGRLVSQEPEAHCFSADGGGFIPGEGVGAVLLKPLAAALVDGDPILGLIVASGVSHGGAGNGFSAPNPARQGQLIQRVLNQAGCGPAGIDYIESAANGSALGDASEYEALRRTFADHPCRLGTVKGNIGHAEAAAGMAQLSKVLCQLEGERLAPTLVDRRRLDPALELHSGPLRLVTGEEPWPARAGHCRRALLTAHGAGGSSAALVVAEGPVPVERGRATRHQPDRGGQQELFLLSARNGRLLRRTVARLRHHLHRHDYHLPSLAYTLQQGREHGHRRLAILATTQEELQSRLTAFLGRRQGAEGEDSQAALLPAAVAGEVLADGKDPGLHPAETTETAAADAALAGRVGQALAAGDRPELARLWLGGVEAIDWRALYADRVASCRLPTSPLASRPFWYGPIEMAHSPLPAGAAGQLPPGATPADGLSAIPASSPAPPKTPIGHTDPAAVASPRSPEGVATTIEAVIREILFLREGDPCAADTTFFDLGIDSVSMVPFIDRLSSRLALPLRPTLVFDYPSVASLSRYLGSLLPGSPAAETLGSPAGSSTPAVGGGAADPKEQRLGRLARRYPELVPLQTKGQGPLLCCLHPMSGDVGLYGRLALAVGGRFRMVGLRALGLLTEAPPLASIEAMAANACRVLSAVDADGPCHLFGASMGGAVAYETARQLLLAGRPVASLFLVEAPLLGEESSLWQSDARENWLMNANFLLLAMLHLDPHHNQEKAAGRVRWPELEITAREVAHLSDAELAAGLVEVIVGRGVNQKRRILRQRLESMARVHLANLKALRRYRPLPLPKTATSPPRAFLLRTATAAATGEGIYNPDYLRRVQEAKGSLTPFFAGWHQLLPQLVTRVVAGENHFALFSLPESVAALGEVLAAELTVPPQRETVQFAGARPPLGIGRGPKPVVANEGRPDRPPAGAIAVVGMAGRFPGAADMDGFWQLVRDGRTALAPFPAARRQLARLAAATDDGLPENTWFGGFLPDIDKFDPLFFAIPPSEAALLDPAERLFLEEAWRAVEDAGINPANVQGQPWGVFCGGAGNYHELLAAGRARMAGPASTATAAGIAGRVSYTLGLTGPCQTVEAGCASSLLAIAQACDALRLADCPCALCGGVWLHSSTGLLATLAQTGMLSTAQSGGALAADADGMFPGEGVAVLVLKGLSRARADGDRIYGVIEGWGNNHNGRSNGISAPSGRAQIDLLTTVHRRFAIAPESITLFEANATGTPLGDRVELEALQTVFPAPGGGNNELVSDGQREVEQQAGGPYCALGTVENSIGHAFHASGVAHLGKILLALHHRTLPGNAGRAALRPALSAGAEKKKSPFYLPEESRPWSVGPGELRRAATSSFGATGSNVYVVVAEAAAAADMVASGNSGNSGKSGNSDNSGNSGEGSKNVNRGAAAENEGEIATRQIPLPPAPFTRRSCWLADETPPTRAAGSTPDAPSVPAALAVNKGTWSEKKGIPDLPDDQMVALSLLLQVVEETTGLAAAEIDPAAPLHRYGVDSLLGMRLLSLINARCATTLQLADLAEHSSIDALAALLTPAISSLPQNLPGGDDMAGEGLLLPAGLRQEAIVAPLDRGRAGEDGRDAFLLADALFAPLATLFDRGIALCRVGKALRLIAHQAVDTRAAWAGLTETEQQQLLNRFPDGLLIAPVSREQELNLYHSEVLRQASRNIHHLYQLADQFTDQPTDRLTNHRIEHRTDHLPARQPAGKLPLFRLNLAWRQLVAKHDLLRTTFHSCGRCWAQVVAMEAVELGPAISEVEMPDLAAFRRFIDEQRRQLLDLAGLPIVRVWLCRLGGVSYLGLVSHHSLADALTPKLLLADLMELYQSLPASGAAPDGVEPGQEGRQRSRAAASEQASEQYWHYTLRQFDPGRAQADIGYWRRQLAGVEPAMRLPYSGDPGRVDERDAAGRHHLELPVELCRAIARLHRDRGISHSQLFAAAILLRLQQMGNAKPVLQLFTSQRDYAAVLAAPGEFTSPLFVPFAADLFAAETRLSACLEGVRKTILAALRHRRTPLTAILPLVGFAGYHDYFQQLGDVLLDSIDLDQGGEEADRRTDPRFGRSLFVDGLAAQKGVEELPSPTFATLSFLVLRSEGRLHLLSEYRRHLFAPATIARLAEQLVVLLAAMATNSGQNLGQLLAGCSLSPLPATRRWRSWPARAAANPLAAYRDPQVLAALHRLARGEVAQEQLVALLAERGER